MESASATYNLDQRIAWAWGELRSRLSQTRYLHNFLSVYYFLKILQEKLPLEVVEQQFLPYVLESLEAWPHYIRQCNTHVTAQECLSPSTALLTKVMFKGESLVKNGLLITQALGSPYLQSTIDLDLYHQRLTTEPLKALFGNPALTQLEKLRVGRTHPIFWDFYCSINPWGLQKLIVEHALITGYILEALASTPQSLHLRELTFDRCTFDMSAEDLYSALADKPLLQNLKLLKLPSELLLALGPAKRAILISHIF